MAKQTPIQAPVEHKGRRGFLPIPTNTFDRVFISVIIFIAISLLWMRFVEPNGHPAVDFHRALHHSWHRHRSQRVIRSKN